MEQFLLVILAQPRKFEDWKRLESFFFLYFIEPKIDLITIYIV